MKQIDLLKRITGIFEYKTIDGDRKDQFVLLKSSPFTKVKGVLDKTQFEATENHVHIMDHIKKDEFDDVKTAAELIGKALINNLKLCYPDRNFAVFATVKLYDSFIVRFHQIWENEVPYYDEKLFTKANECVYAFYSLRDKS